MVHIWIPDKDTTAGFLPLLHSRRQRQ